MTITNGFVDKALSAKEGRFTSEGREFFALQKDLRKTRTIPSKKYLTKEPK